MSRTRSVAVGLLALVVLVSLFIKSMPAQAQPVGAGYVARPFRAYYEANAGALALGGSKTGMIVQNGLPVQYFDKGRLEDHSARLGTPTVLRGRLTAELMAQAPSFQVSGSTTTYGEIETYGATLHAPPPWFTGGVGMLDDGTVFIPFDAGLRPSYGYIVPEYFWRYLSRSDLFPGGWLQDAGLPLSDIFPTIVYKEGVPRQVLMQPFERIVLTYDALNPAEWQIEQGNIGWDAMVATGLANQPQNGPKRIEVSLGQQWLYAYEGNEVVFDAPVSTGKDGWETPTGSFRIFQKLPLKDMKGEARGEEWNVPDVPNIMYFRDGGYAIHGAYWHNRFGTGYRPSHGCVNLPLDAAKTLYDWAPLGTSVVVY